MIANSNNLVNKAIEGLDSVNLLFNLDELSHQIEIIEEAISLARLSIPSSRLISLQELTAAQHTLQDNGLGSDTIDNILDIASAYVMYSQHSIVYVLKIPKVTSDAFTLYYIEPMISNSTRIHLKSKYYLKGPNSFSSEIPCPKTRNLYVCLNQQLEAPDSCIEQLFNGEPSQCPMEKTYGQNFVKKVDDFNIVVNQVNMTIRSNCSAHNQRLEGSYLIQISNCSIRLNNEEYFNKEIEIPSKPFIPTTGLKVTSTKLMDRIPLEYLQQLNTEQRNHINHLNLTTDNLHVILHLLKWLSSGSLSIITIIIIGLAVAWTLGVRIPKKTTLFISEDTPKRFKDEDNPDTDTDSQQKTVMVPQI